MILNKANTNVLIIIQCAYYSVFAPQEKCSSNASDCNYNVIVILLLMRLLVTTVLSFVYCRSLTQIVQRLFSKS